MARFWGQTGHIVLIPSFSALDPTETWAAQDFRSAKALFVPSLKRDIVPLLRDDLRREGSHGNPHPTAGIHIHTGGAAAAWPLAARAQQPANLPTIGLLGAATPSAWSQWVAAFVQRLRELGWIEGSTVSIKYRWAEGRNERYAEIAAEFVRLKVDVIVTTGGAVLATKRATSVIPIVFAVALDPVGSGMVASLAQPGGNVTGLSLQSTDLSGKRLELLRAVVPGLRRFAIIANASYPAAMLELGEVQATARSLGLEVAAPEIRQAEDIGPAFEGLKGRAEAIYVAPDPLVFANRTRISTLALGARLASISFVREYVEEEV